ncbi:MAG: helix-hairpin-helix domain-containing protein [Cytophagales bacterium]|nr:helix-hairpin-helix domain-containing protein [Cytophagales bacterium]
MKKIKFWIRNYFSFTQRETNGFIILSILMALLLVAPLLYKSFIGRQYNNLSDQKLLDSLVAKIDPGSISPDGKISSDPYTSAGKKVLFKFDPNTVSYDAMRQLGMSDLIAKRIIKFRNKGGRFVTKKDLQKIYDLPELLFYQLEVYIVLPELTARNASNFLNNESPVNLTDETFDIDANLDRDKVSKEANKPFDFDPNTVSYYEMRQLGMSSLIANNIIKYRNKGGSFKAKKDLQKIYDFPETLFSQLEKYITLPEKIERFNINIADTVQLQRIYGIGTILSNKVIKFRDKLGGFVSLDQLREVYYGRDSIAALAALKALLKYAYIADNFIPKKILINSAAIDKLSRHPYVSYKLARTIVDYRKQHGVFESVKAVKNIKVLSEEQFEKLAPYLSVDPVR